MNLDRIYTASLGSFDDVLRFLGDTSPYNSLYNLSKQDRNRLRATDLRLEGGVSSLHHDLLQLVDFGDLLLFSGKVVFVENC